MKILLNGILGYMGREIVKLCEAGTRGASLAIGVDIGATEGSGIYRSFSEIENPDGIDCIIDFSHHGATPAMLDFAVKNNIPTVLATTGHTEEETAAIKAAAEKIPLFHSGNMSLGIALLIELAKKCAATMPEATIEIVETHHVRKLDAPSGTALMIAEELREVRPDSYAHSGRTGHGKRSAHEIGIQSVRIGNIVGIHEVIVGTATETITLKHEAHDRALFAEGALAAAQYIIGKTCGYYNMKSLTSEGAKQNI